MSNFKTRRLLSALLAMILLLAVIPFTAIAANSINNVMDYPTDPEEYKIWKDNLYSSNTIDDSNFTLMAVNGNIMYNEFIEASIIEDGKFTMGTTGVIRVLPRIITKNFYLGIRRRGHQRH